MVDFDVAGANVHDTLFHPLIEKWKDQMIVLADNGFHAKNKKQKDTPEESGDPVNLKICGKGQWNERMIIETLFSLFTVILKMKKLTHRVMAPLRASGPYLRRLQPVHFLDRRSQTSTRSFCPLINPHHWLINPKAV